MCAIPGVWTVPDFGPVAVRPRLTAVIASEGTRPCLIFGSSGSGKSVAAQNYSRQAGLPTLWLDAARESLTAAQLADLVIRSLDPSRSLARGNDNGAILQMSDVLEALCSSLSDSDRARAGCCVVLDDLGDLLEEADGQNIATIARCLRSRSARLVVTTRSIESWNAADVCEFALVGPNETHLTLEEATGLVAYSDSRLTEQEIETLWGACGGHVAFFRLLCSQADEYGLNPETLRTASLDAWLERIISTLLEGRDATALEAALLLQTGSADDLGAIGVTDPEAALSRISQVLPLATVTREKRPGVRFRMHDLVDGFYSDHPGIHQDRNALLLSGVIKVLTARGDYARACELLVRKADDTASIDWLGKCGEPALSSGHCARLSQLVESIPIGLLMGKPRLLLLWADVCCEMGQTEDAYSKSRAARSLAGHEGDTDTSLRAITQGAFYLRRLGRLDEADTLAHEILEMPLARVPDQYRAEALFCLGQNHLLRGCAREARDPLERALALAEEASPRSRLVQAARQAFALVPALDSGDFVTSVRLLTPMFEAENQLNSARLMVRGNAAVCLLESGRLHRCETLARQVVAATIKLGLDMYTGAYLPTIACVEVARGETAVGVENMRAAVRYSIAAGDETAADQARVYFATILRAAGSLDEALTEAERAFERLATADAMQFRRLAALEVAASLLSLGDPAAARARAESVAIEGFSGNDYHALRADLILAEIDRGDGRTADAVTRLRAWRDYIVSENPNWLIAMYCRAFPALLGLVTAAIAPEPVPAHLLRMILPEYSEQCMLAARGTLDASTWKDLGERLVGKDEFAAYLKRDGLPLCHVRLFGGLELTIGGRAVREKDWKKRKARLLFAMLAIRRGQDVPRDQLYDYLWPEMDAERAKNNLYVAWSTMKAALVGEADRGAPCPYIESVGGVCRTVRDAVHTDVDDFEQALSAAREAEAAGRPSDALRAYERVADLYRGDLLPGDVYDDWFAPLRDHYRSGFVDAMLRATELLLQADDPGNALVFTRRAIQCDPCREDLYQAALRCQIAAGQRSSAIDTYFQCRDNLSEELGLDPSAETRALYDRILAMEGRPRTTPLDPLL